MLTCRSSRSSSGRRPKRSPAPPRDLPPGDRGAHPGHRRPRARRRIGRNEAFNHAGDAVAAPRRGAGLSVGPSAIFYWRAMAVASAASATARDPGRGHRPPRGRGSSTMPRTSRRQPWGGESAQGPTDAADLRRSRSVPFRQRGDAPLVGAEDHPGARHRGARHLLMSVCIIAAQAVMVPVALVLGSRSPTAGAGNRLPRRVRRPLDPGSALPARHQPVSPGRRAAARRHRAGIFGALSRPRHRRPDPGRAGSTFTQGAVATATGIGAALTTSWPA